MSGRAEAGGGPLNRQASRAHSPSSTGAQVHYAHLCMMKSAWGGREGRQGAGWDPRWGRHGRQGAQAGAAASRARPPPLSPAVIMRLMAPRRPAHPLNATSAHVRPAVAGGRPGEGRGQRVSRREGSSAVGWPHPGGARPRPRASQTTGRNMQPVRPAQPAQPPNARSFSQAKAVRLKRARQPVRMSIMKR